MSSRPRQAPLSSPSSPRPVLHSSPPPPLNTWLSSSPPIAAAALHASFRHIHRAPFLRPPQRQVLSACVPFLHRDAAERIPSLEPDDLAVLANILTTGLHAVRAWGGRRRAADPASKRNTKVKKPKKNEEEGEQGTSAKTSTSGSSDSALQQTPLDASATTSTPPPIAVPTQSSSYQRLAQLLGITAPLPPPPPLQEEGPVPLDQLARKATLTREHCIKRTSNDLCPFTMHSTNDQIHFLPHLVAAVPRWEDSVVWFFLVIVLGVEVRDRLWSVAGGPRSFHTSNALLVDKTLHAMYDRGEIMLLPRSITGSEARPAHDAALYDVELVWKSPRAQLNCWPVSVPERPEDQIQLQDGRWVRCAPCAPRLLRHGNRFRLFTNDASRYPNPHPMLLELRDLLWAMIIASGLGETTTTKRKRTNPTEGPGGHDDDDGDDDDDDDGQDVGPSARKQRRATDGGGGGPRARAPEPARRAPASSGQSHPDECAFAEAPLQKTMEVCSERCLTTTAATAEVYPPFPDNAAGGRRDPWLLHHFNRFHARKTNPPPSENTYGIISSRNSSHGSQDSDSDPGKYSDYEEYDGSDSEEEEEYETDAETLMHQLCGDAKDDAWILGQVQRRL